MGPPPSFYVVLDFEATCFAHTDTDGGTNAKPNKKKRRCEIIEFPMLIVDADSKTIIAEYHEYVRPQERPVLSAFCKSLTGIRQETVNAADTFPDVFKRAMSFLERYDVTSDNGVPVTVGNWDLEHMLPVQVEISSRQRAILSRNTKTNKTPSFFRKWINLKEAISECLEDDERSVLQHEGATIPGMLKAIRLGDFEGRLHSGIDDTRNAAKILIALLDRGWTAASSHCHHTG